MSGFVMDVVAVALLSLIAAISAAIAGAVWRELHR